MINGNKVAVCDVLKGVEIDHVMGQVNSICQLFSILNIDLMSNLLFKDLLTLLGTMGLVNSICQLLSEFNIDL